LTIFNIIFMITDFIEIIVLQDMVYFQFVISIQCIFMAIVIFYVFMMLVSSEFQSSCKMRVFQITTLLSLIGRSVYIPVFHALNKNNKLYIYFITYCRHPILGLVVLNVFLVFLFEIFPLVMFLNIIRPTFNKKRNGDMT